MTLMVSDRQSESDLDSVRDSCDVFYEETWGLIQKSDMGAMVLFCQINREDKGSRRVTCAVRNVPVMFTMSACIGGSL